MVIHDFYVHYNNKGNDICAHLLTPRMACGQFLDVASLTTLLPPLVIQYLSYKNVNLVYVNRAFDKVDFLNPQSAGRRVEKNIVSLFERRSRIRIADTCTSRRRRN